MTRRMLSLLALAALAAGLHAAPKDSVRISVPRWVGALAERIHVSGYAQAGYTATLREGGHSSNTCEMKRAILMVGADITPQFYAFFMHDFKSRDMQEYYMEYRPAKALNVRFGQSKIEYTMENPLSPTTLESIGPMAQGVFWLCGADPLMDNPAGRDLGLMVYGRIGGDKLYYMVEAVDGGQINSSDRDNRKNVIAKLEYRPVPRLRLSVSGQKGYGTAVRASSYNPTVAPGEIYRQDRWAAGLEWKQRPEGTDYYRHRCWTLRAEALGGRDGAAHSWGAYASTAIPVSGGLDVVAMADHFCYNTALKIANTNLMAGLQYWILRKCRLQLQYTYSLPTAAKRDADQLTGRYHQLQAQVQVAF